MNKAIRVTYHVIDILETQLNPKFRAQNVLASDLNNMGEITIWSSLFNRIMSFTSWTIQYLQSQKFHWTNTLLITKLITDLKTNNDRVPDTCSRHKHVNGNPICEDIGYKLMKAKLQESKSFDMPLILVTPHMMTGGSVVSRRTILIGCCGFLSLLQICEVLWVLR